MTSRESFAKDGLLSSPSSSSSSSLNLTGQRLDVARIAQSIRCSKLVTLNLTNISLEPHDPDLLFRSLPSTLEHLILANNQLGDKDLTHLLLSRRLTACSLQTLDLSNNAISSHGASQLVLHFIDTSNSLRRLILSNNFIGAEGIRKIAVAFADNAKALQCLHLQGNHGQLSPTALLSLFRMLQTNPHIVDLGLDPRERRIEYCLEMNRYGRLCLQSYDLHTSLWPTILAKASRRPSILHALVSGRPELFHNP